MTLELGPRNSIPALCLVSAPLDAGIRPGCVAYFTPPGIGGARMGILPDYEAITGAKRRPAHREAVHLADP
ncbi:hypothetical protein [Scleromatobacter humisilvae]|uniref:Uncharacterized protein n=1 Tax=Scleromatobacter humisilvae TaxID=2897159 RepID=A0A9X1YIE9_9BURK|nr:hypothetical protein [Scleromatobacter humisilvae]MCK9685980.1 hypothetical protein [Scleromatobacter humisilvae]